MHAMVQPQGLFSKMGFHYYHYHIAFRNSYHQAYMHLDIPVLQDGCKALFAKSYSNKIWTLPGDDLRHNFLPEKVAQCSLRKPKFICTHNQNLQPLDI